MTIMLHSFKRDKHFIAFDAGADHEKFQYYLIDGFIVSGNVTVESVETQNLNFKNSDHNPILMKVTLD